MNINIEELELNHTIAKDIIIKYTPIYTIFQNLKEEIIKLGKTLDKNHYKEISPNIWLSKTATISKRAVILPPCIIDDNTEVRQSAYLRGATIIGKNCVIGNSSEIKNAIIFDNCELPHFNYLGDSIMGYHSHLGAGVIASNLKSDKTNVTIKTPNNIIDTNLRKMGSIISSYVEVGANSILNPGTIIETNTTIYPLVRVRGQIPKNSIMKSENIIIRKK